MRAARGAERADDASFDGRDVGGLQADGRADLVVRVGVARLCPQQRFGQSIVARWMCVLKRAARSAGGSRQRDVLARDAAEIVIHRHRPSPEGDQRPGNGGQASFGARIVRGQP